MTKHSSTTPAPSTPPAILLIGPPGGGKTALALQFPSVYLADIDQNMQGPINLMQKLKPGFEFYFDRIGYKDDGTPRLLEDQFEHLKTCCYKAANDPAVKTIVVDGVTHLDEILRHKCMKDGGKKEMDISLWGPFRRELNTFIMKLRGMGKTLVVLCHEEYVERAKSDKSPEKILDRRRPLVSTKIVDAFSGYFTDVFRCYSTLGIGNKPEFCIDISPTQYDALKNSYRLHGTIKVGFEESAWAKVNQMLKLS